MSRRAHVLAVCWFVAACREPAPEASEPPAPPVHAETTEATSLVPIATATAEILANREAQLRAETAGRVLAVFVEPGQRVKEGEVLLRLDVGRTESAVQAAQAAVAQTDARLQQARRELERTETLVKTGGLAQQQLDDARDAVRLAEAAQDAARAESRLVRRGLTEAVIRAPFDGNCVERPVELGEYVTPGSPLLTLADTSKLKARVLLDPREALDVSVGAKASVEAYARPDEYFAGTVVRVGEVIDPRTRRLPVEIELGDSRGRLRPGLVARFSVEVGKPVQAIQVPLDAVFERFGRQHVYVVEEGIAHRREVVLGPVRQGLAQVQKGLQAGELLVTNGVSRVVDAAPVRVLPSEDLAAAATPEEEPSPATPPDSESTDSP